MPMTEEEWRRRLAEIDARWEPPYDEAEERGDRGAAREISIRWRDEKDSLDREFNERNQPRRKRDPFD